MEKLNGRTDVFKVPMRKYDDWEIIDVKITIERPQVGLRYANELIKPSKTTSGGVCRHEISRGKVRQGSQRTKGSGYDIISHSTEL